MDVSKDVLIQKIQWQKDVVVQNIGSDVKINLENVIKVISETKQYPLT